MSVRALSFIAFLLLGAAPASAQYSLFRPVPRAQMRAINTDRPGWGDNPYTMDAGRFQIEFAAADVMGGGAAPLEREAWNALGTTLRVGIFPTVEAAVSVAGYGEVRLREPGSVVSQESRGLGTIAGRLKFNLKGADSGTTSIAVNPAVSLAGGSRKAGFLVSVPLAQTLPGGWSLAVTGRAGVLPGAATRWAFTSAAAVGLGRAVSSTVGAYLEGSADWFAEAGAVDAYRLGGGATIALSPGIKFDFGGEAGLSATADAFHFFSGLVVRF